jgi:hypothetical protein
MIDDPTGSAANGRLHNSGAGPREVFRTPSIGKLVTFDLRKALVARVSRQPGCEGDGEWGIERSPAPPELVALAARQALIGLGLTSDHEPGGEPAQEARASLAALIAALQKRGLLRGLAGIASHEARVEPVLTRRLPEVSTRDLARTLAVYAVYAPPLLVWSRTPSLRWFRGDTVIRLRRFGTGRSPRRAS